MSSWLRQIVALCLLLLNSPLAADPGTLTGGAETQPLPTATSVARGWLGLGFDYVEVEEGGARAGRLVVLGVAPNSPARTAGVLAGDVIVALETDEEILDRDALGIQWLLKNHRNLIEAEFALNEGGGVGLKAGRPIRNSVQTSEKVSLTYELEVKDRGGHSSLPRPDNAIYRLAAGLGRLSKYAFPVKLNETTRAYFARTAELESEQTAADIRSVLSPHPEPASLERLAAHPFYNAQLRTTCVATMLEGGHAYNALPQIARAAVNCRILPGEPVDEVRATLAWVLADDQIAVRQTHEPVPSPPSPLQQEIMGAIASLSAEFWPGAPIVPTMSAGATDGSYLRNAGIPTYGHSGLAGDVDDVRAHGKDERVLVSSFFAGQEYLYRLVKMLAGGN